MKTLYLLDAYALIFRAYYALIRSPRINSKGQNTSAIYGFVNTLEMLLNEEHPDYIGIAFDPPGGTFRHEAYPEYKAQREATPEDIRKAVPIIKQVIEAYRIPILEVPGYEADDVIGTLALRGAEAGLEVHMVTPDKDYAQLVRPHVFMHRPGNGAKGFEKMGPEEVCAKYGIASTSQVIDLLGLMGDTADNVPGCPGVGEKTAVKLITQFGSIDQMLNRTNELKGALKKKVEENVEQIRFSKFLVTIKTDVPLPLDLEALARSEADTDRLRTLFEDLEFRNFIKRLDGGQEKELTKANAQPSLFDAELGDLPTGIKETSHKVLADVPHDYHLIENEADAEALRDFLLTSHTVAVDTETTSLDPITAQLVGMSFAVKGDRAGMWPFHVKPRLPGAWCRFSVPFTKVRQY